LKITALHPFETSAIDYPLKKSHISEKSYFREAGSLTAQS